jgi:hypothetical protein
VWSRWCALKLPFFRLTGFTGLSSQSCSSCRSFAGSNKRVTSSCRLVSFRSPGAFFVIRSSARCRTTFASSLWPACQRAMARQKSMGDSTRVPSFGLPDFRSTAGVLFGVFTAPNSTRVPSFGLPVFRSTAGVLFGVLKVIEEAPQGNSFCTFTTVPDSADSQAAAATAAARAPSSSLGAGWRS